MFPMEFSMPGAFQGTVENHRNKQRKFSLFAFQPNEALYRCGETSLFVPRHDVQDITTAVRNSSFSIP